MEWRGFYFPTYYSFFAILNYLFVTDYHTNLHSDHKNLVHFLLLINPYGYIYIYINKYVWICVCVCICIYIYIYICLKIKIISTEQKASFLQYKICDISFCPSLINFHDLQYNSYHFRIYFITICRYSKWPVWRVLLAPSASHFWRSILINFDIIHAPVIEKCLSSRPAVSFAKSPHVRSHCQCSCTWTG